MKKQFKKISAWLLVVALVAVNASCSGDDKEDPTLNVSPATRTVELNAQGSNSSTFTVTTNQSAWDATKPGSGAEWLILTKAAGSFTLTAEPNTAVASRGPVKVTVTAGSMTPIEITVTQAGTAPTLSVTPTATTINFSADGTTLKSGENTIDHDFTVSTNVADWDAVSDQDWLTCNVDKANKKFTLVAAAHISMDAPTPAKVTVSAAGVSSIVINVTQDAVPAFLEVESETATINADGTATTVTVNTNYPEWTVAANGSWLTANKSSDSQITLSAAANPWLAALTATVTVTAGSQTATVSVTQTGSPTGAPPAISATTWQVGTQIWSDYISYTDGNADHANWLYVAVGPGTTGDGKYKKHPNEAYYMYNWYYVVNNQSALCPSPWRVPDKQDVIDLDIALGGLAANSQRMSSSYVMVVGIQGNTPENQAHAEKYLDQVGFKISGRMNTDGTVSYYDPVQCGYIYTKDAANADACTNGDCAGAPGTNKGNYFAVKIGPPTGSDTWGVHPENEYDSSQTKACGLPVRCVRNL